MLMGQVYIVVFTLYLFFMIFSVLNIVTGVFVDGAIQRGNGDRYVRQQMDFERRRQFLGDMLELLEQMDEDGSGTVDLDEFLYRLSVPQIASSIESLGISTVDGEA